MLKRILLPVFLLGLLAACSKKEEPTPAPAQQAQAAPTQAAMPGSDLVKGERIYKGTCAMCHGTGAGGAPVLKSSADWEPRIAQGKEALYDHAVNGFTGGKGVMPAKGGNTSLSDEDVKASVDYMLAQAK